MPKRKKLNADYIRNILFGAEDSLVSTVGVLFGLAASQQYTEKLLVLAGVVFITVEALSMGVGSYLTETEVHEIEGKNKHKDFPVVGGLIMFVSYLFFGISVLLPYYLLPMKSAKFVSVILTLFFLFLVGFLPTKSLKDGVRMLFIAGLAILVGFSVASIF